MVKWSYVANYIIPCLAADFCTCIFHVTLGYKDFDCFSHNIVCYMYSNIHTCNLKCMPNKLHVANSWAYLYGYSYSHDYA